MFSTYVISLKDEEARRDAIAAHLKERGLDFEFFDAIDGRQMNVLEHPGYNAKARRAANGVDLKPGELGCLLSHRALYKKAYESNAPYILVLEDDARLNENTKSVLEALTEKDFDFDIIRLLGSPKVARGKHRKIIPLIKDFWLVRLRRIHGGAHATLISRAGLEKLIKATDTFAHPIDTIMNRTWETGIRSYCIQPGLAVQDLSFETTIGIERHDKRTGYKGFQKFKFAITRALFRLNEAIGKAWIYWGNAPKDLAARKKFS